ncbi:MAG TPA: CDP-diacylglycerol--serine O-phosphatidyltransferase [Thermodesulfobacteriota bacterium]|nr:CDP-diacylglycerol--serine O-phosphatidyltransferase [Thermodesulfobacteriota bacterium]HNU71737.1 CDP-diacylglycerol--serine O-phosphatidyltransferase [Thermodesulfobacteriota bacterium]HOC38635.1 CDP-diacylglycerol--serine O-phosphatidyltransferase [Thermodesulfobacteriota bacterium]
MKKDYFMNRQKRRTKWDRTGIYVLPNLLTTCNLFCGFYSVIASFNGEFTRAAWAIVLAGVFDYLDGRVARMSNAMSQFGVEYDSLTDFVSFGVAPGVMVYTWTLIPFGRVGWLAAFLFVACAALRLARFNVNSTRVGLKYFEGLPSPGAGGMIAATILLANHLGWNPEHKHIPVLLMTFYLSFMMISKIHFFSLKLLKLKGMSGFYTLVALLCIIIIIAAEPQLSLFVIGLLYTLSGPLGLLKEKLGSAKSVQQPTPDKEEDLTAQ